MKLSGKRFAFLIGPGFEDLEFWAVYMRLLEEGATVVVVGKEMDTEYPSKHGGLGRKADEASEYLNVDDFDAVIVPGGWAPDKMRRDRYMTGFLHDMYTAGKPCALICHAGLVAISAGIVKGHRATGSEGIRDDIVNAGGKWVDEPAFHDGNLIWGRVVDDIPAFNRVLIETLTEMLA